MHTTYTLQGNKGTRLVVTVEANPHNVATDASIYVEAVADSAPDFFADALSIEEDFVIARCFDGDIKDGQQWGVALEDGELTHDDMAISSDYTETFTASVITQ